MSRDSQARCDEFDSAFKGFMDGMFAWEVKYFDKKVDDFYNDSEPGLDEEARTELMSLFTKYVLRGGRNYDRIENLACRTPSDYDRVESDIEVVRVNSNKFSVLIKKRRGLNSTFRLTFIKKPGGFMLSKREFKSMGGWCRTHV